MVLQNVQVDLVVEGCGGEPVILSDGVHLGQQRLLTEHLQSPQLRQQINVSEGEAIYH